MSGRALAGTALLLAVLATGWLALHLRAPRPETVFVGPPRSDYTMTDYEFRVLDDAGSESFTVTGPLMSRDPLTTEITLVHPRFRFPSSQGEWLGRAELGRVDRAADQVLLSRNVELDGPPTEAAAPMQVRSASLQVRPRQRTAHSDTAVTITRGNSILSGRGLDAELDSRRLQLHADVRIRHVPVPPRTAPR